MSIQETLPAISLAPRRDGGSRYLFGPVVDFLCLGGLTFALLPLAIALPIDAKPTVAVVMVLLTNLLNHPHFAHSYQIFYRDIAGKLAGRGYDRWLSLRYAFAGFAAPAGLAAFLAYAIVDDDIQLLGRAANVMALLVGWHYVKQGYGMLMVDAALKRQFFDRAAKAVLLANAYAVWILTWVTINIAGSQHDNWGVQYYTFALPPMAQTLGAAACLVTGAATAWIFCRQWTAQGRRLPWNGVMAYGVSLYAWLLFLRINPIWLLIVPALHSLQYLLVVWRFELNRARSLDDAQGTPRSPLLRAVLKYNFRARLLGFAALGILLGFLGFWAAPFALDELIEMDSARPSAKVSLFAFWMFINIHHYLIDNVIWRRQNPEARRFLFGDQRQAAAKAA